MPQSRRIVITGAARGIGRAVARHLALQGHKLFLIDIDEEELTYTATSYLPNVSGSEAGFQACNLRDPSATRRVVKAAADYLGGRIDVLINNAGIARPMWPEGKTMEDLSVLVDWNAYVETNLTAPFVVSQAAIPFMKIVEDGREEGDAVIAPEAAVAATKNASRHKESSQKGTCIINISSFRAKQSQPDCEGYAATKAGLLGLTHGMAVSGAQWGIRSNAILPGYINVKHECREGDEKGTTWAEQDDESRHRGHPVGRVGHGEDIAETVSWLMDAGFVSGQEIVVDGGVSKIKHTGA